MAFLVGTFKAIAFLFRALRRRRARRHPPHLVAEVLKTPYWGGIELPVIIRNTGQAAALDCRYCRFQRFSMDRGSEGPPSTALAWYTTDSFEVPTGESGTRQIAYATADACPQVVLSDVVAGEAPNGHLVAALVCRDRFGTCYRFSVVDGGEVKVESWRDQMLSHTIVFRREKPEWTGWLELPERVDSRLWVARFA
jgi:hypothetical protein